MVKTMTHIPAAPIGRNPDAGALLLPAVVQAGSNRLPALASEIREAHAAVTIATKEASQRALDAGRALAEAKALVGHGGWLGFLTDVGMPERTAQRYMRLATSGLESDTVSDLGGPTAALRFLNLRERATASLKEAEAEALAGRDGLEPIEHALEIIFAMVRMFPEYENYGGAA